MILSNPARTLQRSAIRDRERLIPRREQFHEIVRAIRHSDGRTDSQAKAKSGAGMVEFLAYSGCRKREACSIIWRDVDFDRNQILISGGEQGTKNSRFKRTPMSPQLKELLRRIRPDDWSPQERVINIDGAKKASPNGK